MFQQNYYNDYWFYWFKNNTCLLQGTRKRRKLVSFAVPPRDNHYFASDLFIRLDAYKICMFTLSWTFNVITCISILWLSPITWICPTGICSLILTFVYTFLLLKFCSGHPCCRNHLYSYDYCLVINSWKCDYWVKTFAKLCAFSCILQNTLRRGCNNLYFH